jgi:hypothetical protein
MSLRKSLPQVAQEFGTFPGGRRLPCAEWEGTLRDRHLSRIHLFSIRCILAAAPPRRCRPRAVGVWPCASLLRYVCNIEQSAPPVRWCKGTCGCIDLTRLQLLPEKTMPIMLTPIRPR